MRYPTLFLLLFLIGSPAYPQSLSTRTDDKETPVRPLDALLAGEFVWQMTRQDFEQQMRPSGFEWVSEAKEQARFFGPGLGIWNQETKVSEAIVEFQEDKIFRVNLSLFNRGDSEDLISNREEFEKTIADLQSSISKHLGVQGTERKDRTSAVAAEGYIWMKPPSAYLLEYSYQKEVKTRGIAFRPEFIRLRLASVGGTSGAGMTAAVGTGRQTPVAKASLSGNVKHDESGDVVITNVPMVDQGPKGYCVVATAERVFRYMGMLVDQHEMAQVADTSQGGGTSPDKMYEALNKLEGRLRVRVRVAQDWDFKEFLSMVGDYNRAAKKMDKPEINLPNSGTIYIDQVFDRMDGEALQVAKVERDKAGFGKFQRSVATLIDQGIPVMWSVMLGLLPEKEIPQASGGHMRLIIGYNPKTNEILYSDSWGAGHELKRMPTAQAFTMTNAMYYMEPMK